MSNEPKDLGARACRDGVKRCLNPYHRRKEYNARLEWAQGYAEQARKEAHDARNYSRR